MTIIEYTPDESVVTKATQVKRGTQIMSHRLATQDDIYSSEKSDGKKDDDGRCTFTLCRDVWLFPFSIRDISVNNSNETGVIGLNFASKTELSLHELELDKLRFYLSGDNYTTSQLY
ncbi:type VI secretion system baseplate subunit TssF, partial [Enterobacter hormaechei]|nr:type VI secretion system baseplate subunit TssF [Enterobacter hormaechei]